MTIYDLNETIIRLIVTESEQIRLEIMKEAIETRRVMYRTFRWLAFLITANTTLIILALM